MAHALHAHATVATRVFGDAAAGSAHLPLAGWRNWPIGVALTDASGTVLALNPAARELLSRLGATEPFDDLFAALAAVAPDLRAAAEREVASGAVVERLVSTDAVEASVLLCREADGRLSALLTERDAPSAEEIFATALVKTIGELSPRTTIRRLDGAGRELPGRRRRKDVETPSAGRTLAEILSFRGVDADAAQLLADARRDGSARAETPRSDVETAGRRRYAVALRWLPAVGGGDESFLLVESEVTARREREAELRRLAETDPLTGVLNRRAFFATARRAMEPDGPGVALVALDLDGFKQLNDRLGHAAGDSMLRRVTETARANLRSGDLIGRLGGDEFLIALPGAEADRAVAIAERLRAAIAEAGLADGTCATASFGVAASLPGESFEETLMRADFALYSAKDHGRDAVRLDPGRGLEPE